MRRRDTGRRNRPEELLQPVGRDRRAVRARAPARNRVDPQEYATLHRELIANCRALADSANDVDAAFYRYLEDLAQPWLAPSVLDRHCADREILFDLLFRCKHVERSSAFVHGPASSEPG